MVFYVQNYSYLLFGWTHKSHFNVRGLFGQPNIANILSWHYISSRPPTNPMDPILAAIDTRRGKERK